LQGKAAFIIRAMLVQRVQQQLIDRADLTYQCADALGSPVAAAIGAVLATVTNGGKVLACGSGNGALLAQLMVGQFLGQLERDRPALPAVWMELGEVPRQVGALADDNDLLLLVAETGANPALLAAVSAARERDLPVLALTGGSGGLLGRALRETDVHVCVPDARPARINELHHVVLNCVCDGVDIQLLGDTTLETENPI
jgi:D-sedoheptulose 7-phosphate isomerase